MSGFYYYLDCGYNTTDVERSVDTVKDTLQGYVPDPDAWDEIERTIDRYVRDRRDGWGRDEL